MPVRYKLTINHVVVWGVVRADGLLYFMSPADESEVLLCVTTERAEEISKLPPYQQRRLMMLMERIEDYQGKEYSGRIPLAVDTCPFCKALVVLVADGFELHAFPWCAQWKAATKYV